MSRFASVGIACTVVVASAIACGTALPPELGASRDADADGGGGTDAGGAIEAATDASDGGGTAFFGSDCPPAVASTVPADSPRILVLGPQAPDTLTLVTHLQGMFGGDPAFMSPQVVGQTIDQSETFSPAAADGGLLPSDGGPPILPTSLMYFFYAPTSRSARLAAFASPWTYVVLLEQTQFAVTYPELYFEGVRVLGCAARAAGAQPVVVMTWSASAQDTAARGATAYRVANGTSTVLSPAGYAWAAAGPDAAAVAGSDVFVAAATVYSTLTGRSAAATSYVPATIAPAEATQLAATALQTVTTEAANVHYQSPYQGVVQMETLAPGGTFAFLDWGTSSEALWESNMAVILPKAGFTSGFQATMPAAVEGMPWCDSTCQAALTPYLQTKQFDLLYARYYEEDAATLQAIGAQQHMQVQVWDRHADNIPADGVEAVSMMEEELTATYDEALSLGLAMTPYHLMFSKLKTMRPSVQLTSDGTHATPAVAYGQATMSVVARTSIRTSTAGLDPDSALSSTLADETIRQLSTLSVSGQFVPDDPGTRPTAH